MSGFSDHFGKIADAYADFRPRYPDELFIWLADQCKADDLAWDSGCGSGQASVALAQHFAHVRATDASQEQIVHAQLCAGVEYDVAAADNSGLPDRCVDLITVAQALHWFELNSFYEEVRRVGKPGGVIAAWTYGIHEVEGNDVNARVQHFYSHVVGAYWPPERHHVETGYRELDFPFNRIDVPEFAMQQQWSLAQLLGYLRSWSATARYKTAKGHDPVDELERELIPLWGDPEQTRHIGWPLSILVGRLD
jgi:SAM-dependent methyltransferase